MHDKLAHTDSPSLQSPGGFFEMLRDADTLLELMSCEPLGVVGRLAAQLTECANDAGAYEVANAADTVRRIASMREGASLAGAMQRLASAISHAQRTYHVDAA